MTFFKKLLFFFGKIMKYMVVLTFPPNFYVFKFLQVLKLDSQIYNNNKKIDLQIIKIKTSNSILTLIKV